MKRDPKTKLIGVKSYKGRFTAYHLRQGKRTMIGNDYQTAVEAAIAHDEWVRENLPFTVAYGQLNFKKDSDEEKLEEFIKKTQTDRTRNSNIREACLRSNQIQECQYKQLLQLHHGGESIQDLAGTFDTHTENVIATLQFLETRRLASIGMSLDLGDGKDQIEKVIKNKRKDNWSFRRISEFMGLDKRVVQRFAGVSDPSETQASQESVTESED